MTDHVAPEVRSRIMASVKGTNTTPELVVRSIAHALGYRFRLHRRDLPGKPDLTFSLNGTLAGLVAITAPCASVSSGAAIAIGAIANGFTNIARATQP